MAATVSWFSSFARRGGETAEQCTILKSDEYLGEIRRKDGFFYSTITGREARSQLEIILIAGQEG